MRKYGTERNGVIIGRGGLPLVKNEEELIAQALSQLIDEFVARRADVVDQPCPGGDPCTEGSFNPGCLTELNLNGGLTKNHGFVLPERLAKAEESSLWRVTFR